MAGGGLKASRGSRPLGALVAFKRREGPSSGIIVSFGDVMGTSRGMKGPFGGVKGLLEKWMCPASFMSCPPSYENLVRAPAYFETLIKKVNIKYELRSVENIGKTSYPKRIGLLQNIGTEYVKPAVPTDHICM